MKIILGVIAVIVFGIVCYIFWNNRENDKIVELFMSSVIFGMGTALVSVTFILKGIENKESFLSSVTVLYDKHEVNLQEIDLYKSFRTDRSFPAIPYSRNYLWVKSLYFQEHPDEFRVKQGELNEPLYLQILAYSIFTDLFSQFSDTWTATVDYKKTPTGVLITGNNKVKSLSKEIEWREVASSVDYPMFKKFTPNDLIFPRNRNLHIPHNSEIEITAGDRSVTLSIASGLGNVTINISSLSSHRSSGEIGSILNVPASERQNYATYTYEVKLSSRISRWKSGHPDVELYKQWFKTIGIILTENYSYDKYLTESKEWHVMYAK